MSETQLTWPGQRATDPRHDRVAAFLVLDIQRSPQWSMDFRGKIDEIKSGARASWERLGNAYRLRLSAAGAWIEDLIDPASEPQSVVLEEFEAAVNAWTATIACTPGVSLPPDRNDTGGQVVKRED